MRSLGTPTIPIGHASDTRFFKTLSLIKFGLRPGHAGVTRFGLYLYLYSGIRRPARPSDSEKIINRLPSVTPRSNLLNNPNLQKLLQRTIVPRLRKVPLHIARTKLNPALIPIPPILHRCTHMNVQNLRITAQPLPRIRLQKKKRKPNTRIRINPLLLLFLRFPHPTNPGSPSSSGFLLQVPIIHLF